MSILLHQLKNGIKFNKKVSIYIAMEEVNIDVIKQLKEFHGTTNIPNTIKASMQFFVYQKIDRYCDLFKQFEYRNEIFKIINDMDNIGNSFSYNELNNKYYKVNILLWHLVFCLGANSHLDSNTKGINDMIRNVMDYNYETYNNLFPERFS